MSGRRTDAERGCVSTIRPEGLVPVLSYLLLEAARMPGL